MRKFFTLKYLLPLFIFPVWSYNARAQNSVLINFGDTSCSHAAPPSFSFIKDPLTATPVVLTNCSLAAQVPNFYYVFIAYNPFDHKIYIADTRTSATTIWILDMSLPADISCPANIPTTPDYSYNYTSNNFEFDNYGNLWSFSNYNLTAGQSNIDKFDVTTGNILSTTVLQFPPGNFPSTIYSGDITILPNGRMFAVLGYGPSKLYEINNYNSGPATATFLQTMPKSCFGIAYLNGELELTGFDGIGCYHYEYSIGNNTLGPEQAFQNGQTPVDNTSFSPVVGCAKQLLNATMVNANTADLTYSIYVKNLGNISLNDISVSDDLGAAFGAGNVSNVSTAFPFGSPAPAGIALDPSYNGTTNTQILIPGAVLNNQTALNTNYYFTVIVRCTVTNLDPAVTYLNSAIANAGLGNAAAGTKINVSDSSNNGGPAATDPNNDGNAAEPGENTPTPFIFSILPVHFLNISAVLTGAHMTDADVRWTVAVPMTGAESFEPEYSVDAVHWTRLAHILITDPNRGDYNFIHVNIPPGTVFYRVKQIDNNGAYIYSRTVILHTGNDTGGYTVYPNPAGNYINIISSSSLHAEAALYDAIGRLMLKITLTEANQQLSCRSLPDGTYFLKIKDEKEVTTKKILIRH